MKATQNDSKHKKKVHGQVSWCSFRVSKAEKMNDERVLKAKHSLTFLSAVTVRIPSLLIAEITLSGW